MTQEHPITPPPELRRLWAQQAQRINPHDPVEWMQCVSEKAAQWGADQELEACCEWLVSEGWFKYEHEAVQELRAARRPKPPSLKEQAQAELKRLIALIPTEGAIAMAEPIRRALEQLDD
jgi:hypothetical protein